MRALVLCLTLSSLSHGAEVVFLVRHAEKLDQSKDPPLAKAGEARADKLAHDLADAGITAIFVTQYQRNARTAAPLAKKLGLTPQVIPAGETAALVAKIKAEKGRVLLVGHVDTVPEILKALGQPAPALNDSDYDSLFVVAGNQLIRLRY